MSHSTIQQAYLRHQRKKKAGVEAENVRRPSETPRAPTTLGPHSSRSCRARVFRALPRPAPALARPARLFARITGPSLLMPL